MAQETLVLTLAPGEQRQLKQRLEGASFEHRSVPHAQLSVKGEGVVATLYTSGKLVVQGADPASFTQRYLERDAERDDGPASPLCPTDRPVIGSDEAGKGDYFGPLVVCSLRLPAEHRDGVAQSDVADSKKLTDETVLGIAPVLQEQFECAIEVLDPPAYNARHAEVKNLNAMLADLHAAAIRRLAREDDVVLIDKFADEKLVAERLRGLAVDLYQKPKAEAEPAVAAASVVARAVFLERLRELSDEFAVDLHKGAGAPTDAAGRRFLAVHGFDTLEKVAKVHFKNTRKLGHP